MARATALATAGPQPVLREAGAAKATRFDFLDGVRGVLALSVAALYHFQHYAPPLAVGATVATPPIWAPTAAFDLAYKFGWAAVDHFIILSGFFMSGAYAKSIESGSLSFGRFLSFRLARLYPLHLLTLVLAAVFGFALTQLTHETFVYRNNDAYHLFLNVFMLQKVLLDEGMSFNGPSWSISVEMLCYTQFFFVARFAGRAWRGALVVLPIALVGMALMHSGVLKDDTYALRGLACFSLGVLIQWAFGERQRERLVLLTAAVALAGMALLLSRSTLIALAPMPLLTAATILCWRSPALIRLFASAPCLWLGRISYSLYMIHFPVQLAILLGLRVFGMAIPYDSLAFYLGYVVAILAAAHALHTWVERPLQSRLRVRLGQQPLAPGR